MLLIFSFDSDTYTIDGDGLVFDGSVVRAIELAPATISGEFVYSGGDLSLTRQWVRDSDGLAFVYSGGGRITAWTLGASGSFVYGGDSVPIQITIGSGEGGAIYDGSVYRQVTLAPVTLSGGFIYSGDGVVPSRTWIRDSEGLAFVYSGGGINLLRTFSIEPDGGLIYGGTAPYGFLVSGETIGGLIYGGAAGIFSHDPSGGVILGGGIGIVTFTKSGNEYEIGTDRHRGPVTQPEIIVAMQRRLVETDVFLTHHVVITDSDKVSTYEDSPPNDQFCAILVGKKHIDQGQLAGGGTDADFRTEVFELRVYVRNNVDRAGTTDIWTLQSDRGAYKIARQAASKFQVHDLVDESGTIIVGEPTRILSIGDPVSVRNKTGLGYVPVYVEVKYTEREPDSEDEE